MDPVPKHTILNVLQRIGRKPITYDNAFPMENMVLLPENQVKYMEDNIVRRDTANIGMSRKEVIQLISELSWTKSFIQADNHLDYLIRVKWLIHLKRLGRAVETQATTTELSHIFVSQQYRWHMIIDAEWDYLRRTNSPRDIFICYAH